MGFVKGLEIKPPLLLRKRLDRGGGGGGELTEHLTAFPQTRGSTEGEEFILGVMAV